MTQKKTYLSWLLGLICAFSLMIMFLITSVEAVAYWTPHYYENEYTRYQVADDVHMEMDDLLYVTDEMMAYLRGSRDDLNIDTVVDGTPREFFNAREKAHMADVRNLFLGGLALRRLCLFLAAASVALLALLKSDPVHVLPACIVGSGVAGAMSMLFNCTLMAPHGGIFVFPVMGNPLFYLLALVVGMAISTVLLGVLKKNVEE